MAKAGGESLEKLEDMIVRAASRRLRMCARRKDRGGSVIFGQDLVVEQALVTVLSGGHAAGRRARPRGQAGRHHGHRPRS
jgi:MoxR-like ATPase